MGALITLLISALIAGLVLSLIAFALLELVISPHAQGPTPGPDGAVHAQIVHVATVSDLMPSDLPIPADGLSGTASLSPVLADTTAAPAGGWKRASGATTPLAQRSPTAGPRPESRTALRATGLWSAPAQGGPAAGGDGTTALVTVLNNLRNWIVRILASVATVFLTVAGLRYLTAGGDPGEIAAAKAALKSAFIGYGLAALAPALVAILRQIVGV